MIAIQIVPVPHWVRLIAPIRGNVSLHLEILKDPVKFPVKVRIKTACKQP
jgi:hypothetical protein